MNENEHLVIFYIIVSNSLVWSMGLQFHLHALVGCEVVCPHAGLATPLMHLSNCYYPCVSILGFFPGIVIYGRWARNTTYMP